MNNLLEKLRAKSPYSDEAIRELSTYSDVDNMVEEWGEGFYAALDDFESLLDEGGQPTDSSENPSFYAEEKISDAFCDGYDHAWWSLTELFYTVGNSACAANICRKHGMDDLIRLMEDKETNHEI